MELHQSNISFLKYCPKAVQLSFSHGIKTTTAMTDGLIFEALVLGAKDREVLEFTRKPTTAQLAKRARIESHAEQMKAIYKFNGDAFVKLEGRYKDIKMVGEADFIGEIELSGKKLKCIADLKYTGDIKKNWLTRNEKFQFLQAVYYEYIAVESGLIKEPLPFVFLLAYNGVIEKLVTKPLIINVGVNDFGYVEQLLDDITLLADFNFPPEVSPRCYECPFLQYCKDGLDFISQPTEIDFSELVANIGG